MNAIASLPAQHGTFTLRHLSPVIGTEVLGIDLADVDDDTITWLGELLVDRKVIFFRDQHISAEAHIAFARRRIRRRVDTACRS